MSNGDKLLVYTWCTLYRARFNFSSVFTWRILTWTILELFLDANNTKLSLDCPTIHNMYRDSDNLVHKASLLAWVYLREDI